MTEGNKSEHKFDAFGLLGTNECIWAQTNASGEKHKNGKKYDCYRIMKTF